MNSAIETKSHMAPRKKPHNRKMKRKEPMISSELIDKELLFKKTGPLFWNEVHSAVVQKIEGEQVSIEIQGPGEHESLTVEIPVTDFVAAPQVGAVVTVYLEKVNGLTPESVRISASLTKAAGLSEIARLGELTAAKEPVSGLVASPIKGGYSVTLLVNNREEAENGLGLRAFLPMSQASLGRNNPQFLDDELMKFKIKEFEPKTGNIIVSLKDILLKQKKENQKKFWENAAVGQVLSGVVQSIVSYGAFVDVGGVDGLLHISDMSWEKHFRITDLLREGQQIEVKIIEIDQKSKKLKIGMKQLTEDPWQSIKNEFQAGDDVEGDVVSISDFGVFVHLADGIEGLIHLSEISWQRVKHPSSRFKLGDKVKARILSVQQGDHRISLSTKALEPNPIQKLAEKFPAGAVLKTRITSLKSYGVFVDLSDTLTGLVHIGELSWTKHVEHPSELFTEGQEVEIVVLGFDLDRQRVSCSIKRTTEDPWPNWRKKYAKGTRHTVVVKKLINQGAECTLEGELTGFCPARELSSGDGGRPQDMVKMDQKLDVEVMNFEPREQRITLSVKLRQAKETKEDYQVYLDKQGNDSSSNITLKDALSDLGNRDI